MGKKGSMRYQVTRKTTGGVSGAKSWTSISKHKTKENAKKAAEDMRKDCRGAKRRLKKRGIKYSYRVTIRKLN